MWHEVATVIYRRRGSPGPPGLCHSFSLILSLLRLLRGQNANINALAAAGLVAVHSYNVLARAKRREGLGCDIEFLVLRDKAFEVDGWHAVEINAGVFVVKNLHF